MVFDCDACWVGWGWSDVRPWCAVSTVSSSGARCLFMPCLKANSRACTQRSPRRCCRQRRRCAAGIPSSPTCARDTASVRPRAWQYPAWRGALAHALAASGLAGACMGPVVAGEFRVRLGSGDLTQCTCAVLANHEDRAHLLRGVCAGGGDHDIHRLVQQEAQGAQPARRHPGAHLGRSLSVRPACVPAAVHLGAETERVLRRACSRFACWRHSATGQAPAAFCLARCCSCIFPRCWPGISAKGRSAYLNLMCAQGDAGCD